MRPWIMESEEWRVDNGEWIVESGKWRVESGLIDRGTGAVVTVTNSGHIIVALLYFF